ncbi:ParB/RepB/Spo0J family partition protein [Inconstantimicrobium porci]|uniref:ParB/RepB/Spo0J family partition protein n=1 Tax=Inconstantimicrobium porci TaxID=2652291 RepID=A0A7X2MYY9_9CLOT|nr:ParB/RepB/Spo0J family partition protein [Inconstantimicrobium porci]MSR91669.1 ParB/RepB/Spo0J family partition protein [Inconstantimicrobium porci]
MGKKYGLGKGLGALIPEEKSNNEEDKREYVELNKLKINTNQPRKYFDNEKISELAESIKQHGIIQPILVNRDGEFFNIVAGERRFRAAKLIGLEKVPVIEMNLDDKEILEVSLIENIQRQDLNAIEEAKAYKQLLTEFKIVQEELSAIIGKSRTAISNTLRLLNLDEKVQQYIIEGVLSEGHGRALLGIQNKDNQYKVAEKIIDEKLSVRETERLIKKLNEDQTTTKKEPAGNEMNPYYKDIKNRLQDYFGTKVNINKKKNRGKIEIEYYSEDDLQRILEIMNL